MLWQGAGFYNINLRNTPDMSLPFYAADTPITAFLNDSYTPENEWLPSNTTNARWPIYGNESWGSRSSYQFSQFWLMKGDYLRLKSLELGYTFNSELTKKLRIKSLKLYVSGYNLITFFSLDFLIRKQILMSLRLDFITRRQDL